MVCNTSSVDHLQECQRGCWAEQLGEWCGWCWWEVDWRILGAVCVQRISVERVLVAEDLGLQLGDLVSHIVFCSDEEWEKNN